MKNQIKELRNAKNMTQVELANLVDVSSRTIISLENGKYNPSLVLAYKIAKIFDVTIEQLYYLDKVIEMEAIKQ
ncbi:putative transcriptional regulator [Butyrivibrio fibrisolvens DSM 3071]|uniref:Putative transcriptional regulator n=1 Tax=Butyrivibrio fibrisolvens DSM 3071 TaxID=1121131 RepID=A0A1M5Q520_BUTFI|nr:helix-turn-helix transcriptional regulator [Butyrivibrio fibrisolvens]SHH08849.1 putative transcriptional regulator [Butyrivibrio fibrisolvens DSM 3071]